MENIDKKILKLMRDEKRDLTSREIAEKFFNVNSYNPVVEKIVERTMEKSPAFIKKNGKWGINPHYISEPKLRDGRLIFMISQKFMPNIKEVFFLIPTITKEGNFIKREYYLVSDTPKRLENSIKAIVDLLKDDVFILKTQNFSKNMRELVGNGGILFFHAINGGSEILKQLELGGVFIERYIPLRDLLSSLKIKNDFIPEKTEEIEAIEISNNIYSHFFKIEKKLSQNSIEVVSDLEEFISLEHEPFDFNSKEFDLKMLKTLPERSGVYFFISKDDDIVYIGKSKNLRRRVLSYFRKRETESEKLIKIQRLTHKIKIKETFTELEAILEEAYLIKKVKPKINLREESSIPPLEPSLKDNLVVLLETEDKDFFQIILLNRDKGIILLNEDRKSFSPEKIFDAINSFLYLQKTPSDTRFFGKDILPFALRWLRLNHMEVNYLKQGDFSTKRELVNGVLKYIEDGMGDKKFLY